MIHISNAEEYKKINEIRLTIWPRSVNQCNLNRLAPIFQQFPKLQQFHMIRCMATVIEHDFENATDLIELNLENKYIEMLPENAFRGASKLDTLNLFVNQIHKIDDYAFNGLDNLRYLKLRLNQIETIKKLTFAGAINLKRIDLGSNEIETIENGAFNLPNLENIDLGFNKIKIIPMGLFTEALTIREIILDHNFIETVNITDLLSSSTLETLNFQEIKPEFVKNFCSHRLKSNLVKLDLSFSELSDPNIFDDVKCLNSLEYLYLNRNNFSNINNFNHIKEYFPNLNTIMIRLSSRQLNCTPIKGDMEKYIQSDCTKLY